MAKECLRCCGKIIYRLRLTQHQTHCSRHASDELASYTSHKHPDLGAQPVPTEKQPVLDLSVILAGSAAVGRAEATPKEPGGRVRRLAAKLNSAALGEGTLLIGSSEGQSPQLATSGQIT